MQIERQRPIEPVHAIEKNEPLSKALGWLRGESDKRPVITDDGRPYAIPNVRQLMARGIHDRTSIHKAAMPVKHLDEDGPAYQATEAFADSLAPYLPVVDAKGKLLGCMTAEACAASLDGGPSASQAAQSDHSVRAEDLMDAAMHAFAKTHDAQLPVLDDAGRIAGVLDRAAVLRLHDFQEQPRGRKDFGGDRLDLRENQAKDWMEAGWATVPEAASFDHVVEELQESGYVFVEDGAGRWKGTITAPSLIRSALQAGH